MAPLIRAAASVVIALIIGYGLVLLMFRARPLRNAALLFGLSLGLGFGFLAVCGTAFLAFASRYIGKSYISHWRRPLWEYSMKKGRVGFRASASAFLPQGLQGKKADIARKPRRQGNSPAPVHEEST